MAVGNAPKSDSNAKFVGFVAAIVLLAAVYYLVSSLVSVVNRSAFKDEYAQTPAPTQTASVAPSTATPAAAPAAAPVAAAAVSAAGNASMGKTAYATCAACHGADGKGNGGAFPNLTKLNAIDAAAILTAFKKGDMDYLKKHDLGGARYSTMAPQAANLTDEAIANLAAYIAELGGHTAEAAPTAAAPAAAAPATATVATGDAAAGKTKYATCAACHGADGQGNGGAFPNLTKLNSADAAAILTAFKKGDMDYLKKHDLGGARYSTMAPQAAGLSDTDIADLAAYIGQWGGAAPAAANAAPVAAAASPAPAAAAAPATTKLVSSETIAYGHSLYSSCAVCHGNEGEGARLFNAPKIAGLPYASVTSLLGLYRKGQQMGANSYAMIPQAKNLTDGEISALANYIAVMNTAAAHGASAND